MEPSASDKLRAHEIAQIVLPLGVAGLAFVGLIARSRSSDVSNAAFMVATILGGVLGAASTYHELKVAKNA